MYKIKSIVFSDSHVTGPIEIRDREDKIQGILDAIDSQLLVDCSENPEEFLRDLFNQLFDAVVINGDPKEQMETLATFLSEWRK